VTFVLLTSPPAQAEDVTFVDTITSNYVKWYKIDMEDPAPIEITLAPLDDWSLHDLHGFAVRPSLGTRTFKDVYGEPSGFRWNYPYHQEAGVHYLLLGMDAAGEVREFSYFGHSNVELSDPEPQRHDLTLLRRQYAWFDVDVGANDTNHPLVIAISSSVEPEYLWIDLYDPSGHREWINRTNLEGFTVITIDPITEGTYSLRVGTGLIGDPSLDCQVTSNLPLSPRDGPGSDALAVTSPDGTVVWAVGQEREIEWLTAGQPGELVRLELRGSVLGTNGLIIGSSVANTESFIWRVPDGLEPFARYRVAITSLANESVEDTGWYFEVVPGTIDVTFPDKTVWRSRMEYTVKWESHGRVGDEVDILLEWPYRFGTDFRTVAWNITNDGVHRWTVPADMRPGTYTLVVRSNTYRNLRGEVEGVNIEFAGVPDGHEARGSLSPRGSDWYGLKVVGTDAPIDVALSWEYASIDLDMALYDPSGRRVEGAWTVNGTNRLLYHEHLVEGTYHLSVWNGVYDLPSNYTIISDHPLTPVALDTKTWEVLLEGNETVYYEVNVGEDQVFLFLNVTWPHEAAAWSWSGSLMEPRGLEVSVYDPTGERMAYSRYADDDNIRFVEPLDLPGVYTVVLKGFDRWGEPLNVSMECNCPLERTRWSFGGSLRYGERGDHAIRVDEVGRPVLLTWDDHDGELELRVLGPSGNVLVSDDDGKRNTVAVTPSVEGVYRVQVLWATNPSEGETDYTIFHNQGKEVTQGETTPVPATVLVGALVLLYVIILGAWWKGRRGRGKDASADT
jgi:hypothetical protein